MKNVSESFACCNYKFAVEAFKFFAPGADIRFGAADNNVEIIGKLPRVLKRGLKHAVGFGVALPCRSGHEPAGWLVWRSGRSAFNVKSWGALVDLLAEVAVLKGQK